MSRKKRKEDLYDIDDPVELVLKTSKKAVPDGDCLIVARDGSVYKKTTTRLYDVVERCYRVDEALPQNNEIKLKIAKMPVQILGSSAGFFRWVLEKRGRESANILFYHPETEDFQLVVPPQKAGIWEVKYGIPDADRMPGYMRIGGFHSHKESDAYHSEHDWQNTYAWDGLHVTVGHLDEPNAFSLATTWFVNGREYPLDPMDIFQGLEELPRKKWREAAAQGEKPSGVDMTVPKDDSGWRQRLGDWWQWNSRSVLTALVVIAIVIGIIVSTDWFFQAPYYQPKPVARPALTIPKKVPLDRFLPIKPIPELPKKVQPAKKEPGFAEPMQKDLPRIVSEPIVYRNKVRDWPWYVLVFFYVGLLLALAVLLYFWARKGDSGWKDNKYHHGTGQMVLDEHGNPKRATEPSHSYSWRPLPQLYRVPDESFPEEWKKQVKKMSLAKEVVDGGFYGVQGLRSWRDRKRSSHATGAKTVRTRTDQTDPDRRG